MHGAPEATELLHTGQTFAKTKINTNILDLAGAAQRILVH